MSQRLHTDHSRRRRPGPGADERPRFRLLLALTLVLALVAAACGSSDDEDTSSEESEDASDGDFATEDAEVEAAGTQAPETTIAATDDGVADDAVAGEPTSADAAEADGAELGTGGAAVTPTAADLGRKLIFTADLTVEVDDVAAAGAEATSIIEGLGGFVFGQDTQGGAQPVSRLTFKILPDDFNRALEELGSVGELRNQIVTTDDVTERIVDLESRIEVADLGVQRLRAALEGAATLEDYAELERLLLARESELEIMRGQLRTLEDRVDLATITLTLTQDRVDNAIELRVSVYEGHDDGQTCPGREEISVEADRPATVCFDITNTGDQTLTAVTLTDTVLEIDAETELIEVFGTLDELAPGQAALVAFEARPARTLGLRPRVTAVPTDGVTAEPAGPSVSTQVSYRLRTFEPDRDPGFSDGFDAAVGILRGLWTAFWVILGFVLPLLILVPFIVGAWWGLRRLRRLLPSRPTPPPPVAGPSFGGAVPPPPGAGSSSPSSPSEPVTTGATGSTAPDVDGGDQ